MTVVVFVCTCLFVYVMYLYKMLRHVRWTCTCMFAYMHVCMQRIDYCSVEIIDVCMCYVFIPIVCMYVESWCWICKICWCVCIFMQRTDLKYKAHVVPCCMLARMHVCVHACKHARLNYVHKFSGKGHRNQQCLCKNLSSAFYIHKHLSFTLIKRTRCRRNVSKLTRPEEH